MHNFALDNEGRNDGKEKQHTQTACQRDTSATSSEGGPPTVRHHTAKPMCSQGAYDTLLYIYTLRQKPDNAMATHNDTGNKAPVEDFCPQPDQTVSTEVQQLLIVVRQQAHLIEHQQSEILRLDGENRRLRNENALLKMRNGQQRAKICDAVWALFSGYLDHRREEQARSEVIDNQGAWWYMQYDFLCIRRGHITDLLKYLREYMDEQHKRQFTVNNNEARDKLTVFIIQHIRIYTSGAPNQMDYDSLRHPIRNIFPPRKTQ